MNINSIYRCTILSLLLLSRLDSVISDPYGGVQPCYDGGGCPDLSAQYYGYPNDQGYSSYDQGYSSYGQGYSQYDQSYDQSYTGYDPSYDQSYTGYDQSYNQGYSSYGKGYDQAYTGYEQSYDQGYSSYGKGYDPSYDPSYSQYDPSYSSPYMDQGYGGGYHDPYSHSQYPGYSHDGGYQDYHTVDKYQYGRHHKGRDSFAPVPSRGATPARKSHYKHSGVREDELSFGEFGGVSYDFDTRTERSFARAKSSSSSRYKESFEEPPQPGEYKTVLLDISNKKTTKSVIYDFDDASQTHTFTAADGYLFEAAIDENAELVWEPENNRYADKLTVTETSPGFFSIKAFVPVDGTSSSDFEPDRAPRRTAGRRLDKRTGRPEPPPKFESRVVRHDPSSEFEMAQRHRHHDHGARRTTIDIEVTQRMSTDQVHYHYNKRYFIHSFKPKAGFKIGRVTKGGKVKYEHDRGENPDEVIMIVLPDKSEVMRVLFPSTGELVESEPEYVMAAPKPTLVDVDVKRFESTDGVDYTFDKKHNIHRFICKQNHLITTISKLGKIVRRFADNNWPDRLLIINIPGERPILRVLYPGQDEGLEDILKRLTPSEPEKVEEVPPTLITVDVKKLNTTDKIEYREEEDGTRVFVCKSGYLINKIVKEDTVLESFTENFPNKVTVSLDQHGKRVVDFSSPFKPELITLDIRNRKTTSQFEFLRDHKNRDLYTAIRPYLFYEVRKDNDLLWYSRDGRYPEKVYIIPVEGSKPVLRVFYPKDMTFPKLRKVEAYRPDIYKRDEFEEPPEPPEPPEPQETKKPSDAAETLRPPKSLEPTKHEPAVKYKPTPAEEADKPTKTYERAEPEPTPEEGEIDIVDAKGKPSKDKLHPFRLNLSHHKNTDEYAFNSFGHLGRYKANVSYGFNEVVKDSDKIWSTIEPEEYAVDVYADGIGLFQHLNNVTIYTAGGQYLHYHKYKGKNWIKIPAILELDIDHKGTTLHVDYASEGKLHIFEANHNFVFNKVFEKDKLVWDSRGRLKCVKVMFREDGPKGKEVTVYLPDGVISFRKDKVTDKWVDFDTKEGALDKVAMTMTHRTDLEIMRGFDADKISIFTADPNDVTKPKENDTNSYRKTADGEDYKYELSRGAKCLELKYDGRSFWRYEEDKHGSLYPKSVQFQKESLLIVVEFGVISLKYKFNGEEMILAYTKKPAPIEVDMSKSDISEQPGSSKVTVRSFDRDAIISKQEGTIVTYTTKEHYAMNPIKYKSQQLSETSDPFSYVSKVQAQPVVDPKRMRIFYLNGKIKNFAQSTDGNWSEFPANMDIFT